MAIGKLSSSGVIIGGMIGQKGAMGKTGPIGKTPHLTIGNVEIVEKIEQANVTITGSDENPVINISLPRGEKGQNGETGLTPNIKIGNVSTLNANEKAIVSIGGTNEEPIVDFGIPRGEKGDNYVLQEKDKQEIVDNISNDANSKFYENVTSRTKAFNDNAISKTEEYDKNARINTSNFNINAEGKQRDYNINAESKLEEYNQNAKSCKESFDSNVKAKTTEFNDNATEKITSFNSNSISKINEFDSNATSKTDDFNNVANSETEEFNSNVLMQTNTFNKNAASKLQEYNDNATQKIEEYDAHSEELDNKIIATRNELERVKNDVLETGTDTDTYIHLEDSAMAEYQELSVDGVCKQETISGKNLWNFNERTVVNAAIDSSTLDTNKIYNSKTRNNINGNNRVTYTKENETITMKTTNSYNGLALPFDCVAGETYTISATISDNTKFSFGIGFFTDLTYVSEVSSWNENSYTFTIPENINKMLICITPTVSDLDITISNIQLELGSSATSYEPYTGGQPSPSPDYPQEMEVIDENFELISCGKNMMPFYEGTKTYNGRTYKFENGTLTINGISTEENAICLFNGERTAKYVSATTLTKTNSILFPAGTYKISRVNVENGYSIGIKHGKLGTVGTDTYIGSEYNTGTLVLNKAEWVTLLIYDFTREEKQVIMKNFQIEINSTVTEYEPYRETRTTITLPEGEFAGKIDENTRDKFRLAFNEADSKYHLYLDKVITKRILNNTNTWHLKTDQMNENTVLFVTILTDVSNKYDMNAVPMKCNRFTIRSVWDNVDVEGCLLQSNNSVFMVRINKNRLTELTVDAFKTWVSNNQLITYYAVRNPYTLDLGAIDMPLTYYPITNVYTTCDLQPTIEVSYYRYFKGTIKSMQDDLTSANMEIDTLKNEVNALKEQVAQLMTSTILEESEAVE